MGLTAYAGLFEAASLRDGRRRLGVGGGRRGRQPRRAAREAPRPPRDRERGLRREGSLPAGRARARRGVQLQERPGGRAAARRPRPTGSTSTSTTSAATTSRRRSARCAGTGASRSAARSLEYDRADATPAAPRPARNLFQADGERADAARLPWQQLHPSHGRDAARGLWLAPGGQAPLPRVGRPTVWSTRRRHW